jgi:hypothetical protein
MKITFEKHSPPLAPTSPRVSWWRRKLKSNWKEVMLKEVLPIVAMGAAAGWIVTDQLLKRRDTTTKVYLDRLESKTNGQTKDH